MFLFKKTAINNEFNIQIKNYIPPIRTHFRRNLKKKSKNDGVKRTNDEKGEGIDGNQIKEKNKEVKICQTVKTERRSRDKQDRTEDKQNTNNTRHDKTFTTMMLDAV